MRRQCSIQCMWLNAYGCIVSTRNNVRISRLNTLHLLPRVVFLTTVFSGQLCQYSVHITAVLWIASENSNKPAARCNLPLNNSNAKSVSLASCFGCVTYRTALWKLPGTSRQGVEMIEQWYSAYFCVPHPHHIIKVFQHKHTCDALNPTNNNTVRKSHFLNGGLTTKILVVTTVKFFHC